MSPQTPQEDFKWCKCHNNQKAAGRNLGAANAWWVTSRGWRPKSAQPDKHCADARRLSHRGAARRRMQQYC